MFTEEMAVRPSFLQSNRSPSPIDGSAGDEAVVPRVPEFLPFIFLDDMDVGHCRKED